jgi:hypothetical protein
MGKPMLASSVLISICDIVKRFYDKSKHLKAFVENIVIAKALSTIFTLRKEE